MKRKFFYIPVLAACALCVLLLSACSALSDFFTRRDDPDEGDGKHEHNYSSTWSSDGDYHWYECQNDGCDQKQKSKAAHLDSDADGECDECGRVVNAVSAHAHDYKWVNNGDGTHKQHCSVDGCDKPDISEGNHDFSDGDSCECGAKKPAADHAHSLKPIAEVAASCTDGGHLKYYSCSGCDKLFSDENGKTQITLADVEGKALGHNFETYISDGNATCEGDGTKTAECSRCHKANDTLPDEGSALDHDYISHGGRAASCFKAGWAAYQTCSRCTYTSYRLLDPVGHHTMKDGACSVCGAIDWEYGGLNLAAKASGTYGYEYLGTMQNGTSRQNLYKQIDEAATALHNNAETDYLATEPFAQVDYAALNLTADDAIAVWKTYLDDNPLYYWFSNGFGYNTTELALFVDQDYLSAQTRNECNKLIYNQIKEYLDYAQSETSAYQKALAFHDKIISAVDYAYDSNGVPEDGKWAHSIMGVFEKRGAVCEGYAKTFQLLLTLSGVENIMVNGHAGAEAHAWNLIKLDDGEWYWCDLTWDDMPTYEWGVAYNYFCVNDTQGVDWADGGNQYGNETGLGLGGSPAGCDTFLTRHTAYSASGKSYEFLYALPERSKTVYQGVDGELKLRDTFEVGDYQYAIAGYRTVQLTKANAIGAAIIAQTVTYNGEEYTVISVGAIGGTGLFGAGDVFGSSVTAVKLPASVIYIWSLTFYSVKFDEITFDGTKEQWSAVQKTIYWKNDNKQLTVHCTNGEVVN